MKADWIALACMAVFFLLYGFLAVTSVKVEAASTIMGFAALVLGVVCVVKLFSGGSAPVA